METPEGFRRVTFAVISEDGHRLPAQISCLVCRECQAMVLQNDYNDYAEGHRLWHEKSNEAAKKLSDIYDAAAISGSKDYLDAQADWEKTDSIQGTKRRR